MANMIFRVALMLAILSLLGCYQRTTKSSRVLELGMSKAEARKLIGHPLKKSAYTSEAGDRIEIWHLKETTWDDGGWSWDRTIVRSNVIFKNGVLDAIGQDEEQYKSKNPFNPGININIDKTVRHRN